MIALGPISRHERQRARALRGATVLLARLAPFRLGILSVLLYAAPPLLCGAALHARRPTVMVVLLAAAGGRSVGGAVRASEAKPKAAGNRAVQWDTDTLSPFSEK